MENREIMSERVEMRMPKIRFITERSRREA